MDFKEKTIMDFKVIDFKAKTPMDFKEIDIRTPISLNINNNVFLKKWILRIKLKWILRKSTKRKSIFQDKIYLILGNLF